MAVTVTDCDRLEKDRDRDIERAVTGTDRLEKDRDSDREVIQTAKLEPVLSNKHV
jgi:hypothetical protein